MLMTFGASFCKMVQFMSSLAVLSVDEMIDAM